MKFQNCNTPCIYKAVNIINGKIYIGKSINFAKRYKKHKYANYYNTYFHNAIRKYGFDSFEFFVIEECEKGQLIERENKWILHFRSNEKEFGYNLRIDSKENSGWTHSQEARKKIGAAGLGRQAWNKGIKIGNNRKPEELKAFGIRMSGANNPIAKRVYQFDLDGKFIESYGSAGEAARKTNVHHKNICAACLNQVKKYTKTGKPVRVKTAGNFKWSYLAPYLGNMVSASSELLENPKDVITTTQP